MAALHAAVAAFVLVASAEAAAADPVEAGAAAVRARDWQAAWALLSPAAEDGSAKAKRLLALVYAEGRAPVLCAADGCRAEAGQLLADAARGGDDLALVRLEELRRAGGPGAPTIGDIVAIEIARAEASDPVAALRLARRYETGDGVAPSERDMIRYLTIAAESNASDFPKATDAAFRLCEALVGERSSAREARSWCERAADAGHVGAALVLSRLRAPNG